MPTFVGMTAGAPPAGQDFGRAVSDPGHCFASHAATVTVSCRGKTDVQGGDGLAQGVSDAVAVTRRGDRQEFFVG
jgi:hypothetical protein